MNAGMYIFFRACMDTRMHAYCYTEAFRMLKVKATVPEKGTRKVQGVPQSQTAALPRHQKEAETDKTKPEQIDQTYEKHKD